MEVPGKVSSIIYTLEKAGYEAYVVGGCVRDMLLGREPHDWDITTSAKPDQIKRIFGKTIDTGLKHGTVTVMVDHEGFEITTYRIDGDYEDGRHPKEVSFTSDLTQDLCRRDFTVNAMAYHPARGLVDLFGGEEDLKRGLIRCVGDPAERFSEDALRMLRAVRFSAQLGFDIHGETRKAVREMADTIRVVSAERIREELVKTLLSSHPDGLRNAYDLGLTAMFLPEFDRCMECPQNNPHHAYTVGEHILHSLTQVRADEILRMTMLLHDIAKPVMKTTDENGIDHFRMHAVVGRDMAEKILRRLKTDNKTIHAVCRLIEWHDLRPGLTKASVRRAVTCVGEDLFPMYMEVRRADMLAQSDYYRKEKEAALDQIAQLYQEILNQKEALSIKDLAVNGYDLAEEAGIAPGPMMGEILNALLEQVLDDPALNERETLLELAKRYGSQSGLSLGAEAKR